MCLWQLSYGAARSVLPTAPSTPSLPLAWATPHPSSNDSCKMKKLPKTVELELWAWWMSSKCGLIPWGVARGGGWPSWWHLMECGAFYLGDVNLSADQVEWKPATTALKAVFRVRMHTAPLPVWSPLPVSRLSGLNQLQFGQTDEGRGSRWGYCLYHDVHRPGKSYPAHYEWDVIHHWFVSK